MKELCRRAMFTLNRKKNNQKHKKVLELKEDAEATDENNNNKEGRRSNYLLKRIKKITE